jgi:hypothetical protein
LRPAQVKKLVRRPHLKTPIPPPLIIIMIMIIISWAWSCTPVQEAIGKRILV